jgi:hypothetical protein
MKRLALIVSLGALASACVTTRAATRPVERPALEVPPAPPRIVEPTPLPEATHIEPVSDIPPAATAPPASRSRPSSRESTPRETKPDPKQETAPPPAAEPQAPAQNVTPAPTLRTPATKDTAGAERQIRDTLQKARTGLRSVDYQRLSQERKKAYDEANAFIAEAESAIKTSNFELAQELADKAEKFSKELQQR